MVKIMKGDIVVIKFPFTDFSNYKKRPALVLATLKGDDIIICQITSKRRNDPYAIEIDDNDIIGGTLYGKSYVRPSRLVTIDKKIVEYKVGHLNTKKFTEILEKIKEIFSI